MRIGVGARDIMQPRCSAYAHGRGVGMHAFGGRHTSVGGGHAQNGCRRGTDDRIVRVRLPHTLVHTHSVAATPCGRTRHTFMQVL